MNSIELGKFLSKLRQEKGLTQEKLAEMLNIDKRKVSRWETGISTPEFDMLIKLSEIFDITLYELSIGKRIKDKTIREMAKEHFRNISDYQRYSVKRNIITLIAVFIGLFLGFAAVFTINNYQKTTIYTFYSIDDNYRIQGGYIKINNYGFLYMTDIEKQNKTIYNNDMLNYVFFYEIQNHHNETIIKKMKNAPYNYSFLSHEECHDDINFNENEIYTFVLNFYDDEKKISEITFDFKVTKKFTNNIFAKTPY